VLGERRRRAGQEYVMSRKTLVIRGVLIVGVVAVGVIAWAFSHDGACGSAPVLSAGAPSMKASVARCYGSPDLVRLETLAKPLPADDRVLVKVRAASVNPLDWHYLRGKPYFMRSMAGIGTPDDVRMGVDFAGTVEAVGKSVSRFKVGDEVFGGADGAFAEYVTVREAGSVALKPGNLTFEQVAAVPIAGITALQALRDEGRVKPGQAVLVNGASGGVGTFAVQIAKAYGATVTAVCSTRNVDMVRAIGADRVIDYTKEDFTKRPEVYDVIIDTVGTHSLSDYRRALTPQGSLVIVGALSDEPWLGPLADTLKAKLVAPFVSQRVVFFLAQMKPEDLQTLRTLMEAGKVTPVIDRRYPLSEVPQAIRYLEQGHARGKVVIDVG
jgi:NADPH:quinone reductase-like Zn-dependent oxidoreductase